jgi:hypothetical protein
VLEVYAHHPQVRAGPRSEVSLKRAQEALERLRQRSKTGGSPAPLSSATRKLTSDWSLIAA